MKDASSSDCAALLSLGGTWGLWAGLGGITYCGWAGVTCSAAGRVTQLSLGSGGRSGPLPAALSSLGALAVLDVSNNALTGTLDALASDTALRSLLAAGNQFTGARFRV